MLSMGIIGNEVGFGAQWLGADLAYTGAGCWLHEVLGGVELETGFAISRHTDLLPDKCMVCKIEG